MTELTPDEIRAIREGLGLTQREAGQRLGGGPSAFAKYEAGTVTPSAALTSLLVLLRDNPNALQTLLRDDPSGIQTLQQEEAPTMPLAPALPFEVTGDHAAALSERTLPQLLRLLLSAEAHTHRLPADGIHVSSNIHAADGGEDGRIEWTKGPGRTPFLPARLCQFQLKAGQIAPARARSEVLTSTGAVKPMVRSVLEKGGRYIILCAHAYTQMGIEARESRIREALRGAGLDIDDAQVDFRDAGQIASWVNHHPSVAHWILERVQPSLLGLFRSWNHWDGRADYTHWVEDERLDEIVDFLRERVKIAEPQSVGRLVGLAGVGKSRLALQAFRPTTTGDSASDRLHSLVLYADEAETAPGDINTAVQDLADSGTRAIIVVDRCAPETHHTLSQMVMRSSSRLSLLTLDDEIPPNTLGKTTLTVPEAPASVTEAIVNQAGPGLRTEDQHRLVRFSQGFPGIAVLVAQAWLQSTPLADATDDHLVDTYILGRSPREPDLLLKAAKLLAAFGLVGIDRPVDGQLDRIANLGRNITADDLRACAKQLAARGVARQRGRYVSIEPRPVAMNLAARQWKEWGRDTWDRVLTDSTLPAMFADDLSMNIQAAKQLALLNTLSISREVVKEVCRYGGLFDGLDGLLAPGRAGVLSSLVEVDTRMIADQIERSLTDVEDLSRVAGDARRFLVWALEKAAFNSETFEEGAHLLLRLAAAENETASNNAAGQFAALFPMLLGGTAADGAQRLSFLGDITTAAHNTRHMELAVRALDAGLELDHFGRSVGPEVHGSRPALASWQPATRNELDDYINGCVDLLARLAIRGGEAGAPARRCLGRKLDPLVRYGFINTVERVVEQVQGVTNYWPEAQSALGRTIAVDAADRDAETADRVRSLIEQLQPQSLETRVRSLVTAMPWNYLATEDMSHTARYQRQAGVVRGLAAEAVKQPETFWALLPQLSRGQQRMTEIFGRAAAEFADIRDDWLEPIEQAVAAVPEEERNFDLLVGYLTGIAGSDRAVVEEFKQRAAESPVLAPALPLICGALGVADEDAALLKSALQAGLLSPQWLTWQTIGQGLADAPAAVAAPLFDVMIEHSSEGFAAALDLMGLYTHQDAEMLQALRPQIRKAAENAVRWDWAAGPHSNLALHSFGQIITWMLNNGRDDSDASETALLLATAAANVDGYQRTYYLESVLPALLSGFPEVAWPLIGQAIVSAASRKAFLLEALLGDGVRFGHRESNPPILHLPENTLFAWCRAHPDRAPAFAAKTVPLLDTSKDGGAAPVVHPLMVRLIAEFGGRKDVQGAVAANMDSGSWSGPREGFWAMYQEPLAKLLDHPAPGVRRWAKKTLRRLKGVIEDARVMDVETEARWGV